MKGCPRKAESQKPPKRQEFESLPRLRLAVSDCGMVCSLLGPHGLPRGVCAHCHRPGPGLQETRAKLWSESAGEGRRAPLPTAAGRHFPPPRPPPSSQHTHPHNPLPSRLESCSQAPAGSRASSARRAS